MIGKPLGHYRITERLGAIGMGFQDAQLLS